MPSSLRSAYRGSIQQRMSERGTWLCPTPLHRMRLLDMEAKLALPRTIMYGSLAIVFLIAIPWFGWVPFLPLIASVVVYSLLRPRIAKSARPEYIVAATVLNAQILIGVAIALTGGANSPAIPFILLPLVTLPARFSARGVYVGLAITVVTLLCGAVGADPSGFVDNPTYVLSGLATAGGLTAFAHFLMNAEMQQRSDSVLDPLTGLLNRKSLIERFAEIAEQAALTEAWVCVLACDLDHFKRVNDVHGHGRGDQVLKDAAYVLRKQLRSFELLYRLGGEEFLVVLPGLTLGEGRDVAERARVAVEEARPGGLDLTASMGVAAARGADVAYERLVPAADTALYEAKRTGRNRVVAEGGAAETRLAGEHARGRAA
jgi:diguanylate cyclase (GGDEF)-like protein